MRGFHHFDLEHCHNDHDLDDHDNDYKEDCHHDHQDTEEGETFIE